jgi:hypothetical protein
MSHTDPTEPLLDPRLERLLGLLRPAPPRDEQAAARGRARFLAELDSIPEFKASHPFARLTGWFIPKSENLEGISMNSRTKLAFTTILSIIIILVFLFGGAGATAFAARSALPGDALYPVKTSLENTQVVLAGNAYAQAQLSLRFAELRLEELDSLVKEGRYGDIDQAARQFENHVQAALRSMQTVMAGNPALGAELSQQISQALLRYAQVLKSTWITVPQEARPPLERMIQTSQFGSGSSNGDGLEDENEVEVKGIVEAIGATKWTISGKEINISESTKIEGSIKVGDAVEVSATKAVDGSLTAIDINLEDQDGIIGNDNDDGNVNDNDDGIVNDNDDGNVNDNDDGIVNDNDDGNVNDNDDDNGNENIGNDNENDNGNENIGNDNGNDNGNENIGNDKGNGNDNGNDNGGYDGGNDNGGNDNGGDHGGGGDD